MSPLDGATALRKVLLVGKPNSGKSLLFNRLTGLNQKVANFPGVTVEVKSGRFDDAIIVDFPGIYSLEPVTKDEEFAVERLKGLLADDTVAGVALVLDGTRLERSLFLSLQVAALARKARKPCFLAVNMIDEVVRHQDRVDTAALAHRLGVPVYSLSGKTGEGLEPVREAIRGLVRGEGTVPTTEDLTADGLREQAAALNREFGPRSDVILKSQNRLDSLFLGTMLGGVLFVLIMVFLFQSIFTWSSPLMDAVEGLVAWLGEGAARVLPPGVLADFLREAIFGGVGSFLVFVPQIFVMTFIIGVLEDSGYLVRAAIICHRPLSLFGLSGRSFVALLCGHACAIPAIFATRNIESPRKRLLTIITLPFMSCSARLPVYSLLVTTLVPPTLYAGGLLGLQGLTFFALYALGIAVGLVVSGLLSRTVYRQESDAPFVLELPPYRLPSLRPLLKKSLNSAWAFVTKAGGVIFAVTVVVWVLGYFPQGSGHLADSWLGSIGRFIEPVFSPLGLDWKYGVAVLASFLAREVFVGTLGTLFGIEAADENIADLSTRIQASGLTSASGFALLVFYVLALQCVSTLAVIRKETGSARLPVAMFVGYTVVAYTLAFVTYQIFSL